MRNSILTFLAACLLIFATASAPFQDNIAIIVNKDNPVEKLEIGEVKLYYLRKIKKRWPGLEKNIRPADRKSKCSEQNTFYSNVLKMTGDEVTTYFAQKQIQNAERPPDKFNSEAELIEFVANEPGAIGFIKASSITADVKAKVKVVNP